MGKNINNDLLSIIVDDKLQFTEFISLKDKIGNPVSQQDWGCFVNHDNKLMNHDISNVW